jgi:NADH-quinone oxidoreductase subunit H
MPSSIQQFIDRLLQLALLDYLRDSWGDQPWVDTVIALIGVLTVATFCLLIVLFLIWFERKVIARFQDRIGPNRVGGKFGLLQTVADALKLMTKEDLVPTGADKLSFNLAPLLAVMSALLLWAVIPFAPGVIGTDLNIGILYIAAISSTSAVGILLAGWGSNNKYALLGAFRMVAQLISYEVPLVLSLLIPVLLARTMYMQELVQVQTVWFIVVAPLAAFIFFTSALAELGRTPFDLLEAESEIIGGFHTEYSGMKFAMFFLAEFINTLFMSALFATIFLGGWRGPGAEQFPILGLLYFFIKSFLVYFAIIWVRGTFPRIRVDQLSDFNWKFLVPVSVALVFFTALVEGLLPADINTAARVIFHLATNVAIAYVALEALRRYSRRQRAELNQVAAPVVVDGHHGHGHDHGHAAAH